MARKVNGDEKIIDPFNGAQDLKDKFLRSTTERALDDDPLRCLRAVRLAAQFGLRILPETKDQIRQYNKKLKEISTERIRDELFRILEGPNQTAALQSLEILGLSPYIFFGEITEKQIKSVRYLENLWFLFRKEHDQDSSANWSLALLVHRLGRYRADLQTYLNGRPVPGRTIYQLSFIAALLNHLTGENGQGDLQKNLPLSNQEWDILVRSSRAADTVIQISQAGDKPRPVNIYRYYRQYGSAGVLGVFLALSSSSTEYKYKADQEDWITILEISRSFLEGWWEKKGQWVQPPSLLNGDDIQGEFSLTPGPRIGALLESLREAQVERGISSRGAAIQYLNDLLDQENEMPA
jgi:poly(A) polymerase